MANPLVASMALALLALQIGTWWGVVRLINHHRLNIAYAGIMTMTLWSYALAVCSHPGPACDAMSLPQDPEVTTRSERTESVLRYCERCDAPKPARVHHCSTCRCCVYRMDHHCPWTSNCVGWRNKKYFLLFLVYATTSCALYSAMAFPLAWGVHRASDPMATTGHAGLVQLAWTLSVTIGGLLAGYFCFHVSLLYNGKTTLDVLAEREGEFATTSFWFNVRVYFGSNYWFWWLPVPPTLDPTIRGAPEAEPLLR